jgi:signal transduction histidine kinase
LQGMSAVAMRIHAVRAGLPASAAPVSDKLAAIEASVTASLAETRRFVWELREEPEHASSHVDLGESLRLLAARMGEEGCRVVVAVEGAAAPLAAPAADELQRIAGEALANALRHADAHFIDVRLCYQDSQVTLTVADDGRGFDTGGAARPGHFGLQGLRERAARLGADLRLDSRPGHGTRVEVTVPLARRERALA